MLLSAYIVNYKIFKTALRFEPGYKLEKNEALG